MLACPDNGLAAGGGALEEAQAVEDFLDAGGGKGADVIAELGFGDGGDFGDFDDAGFGKIGFARVEKDVAGGFADAAAVGGERADDDGVEATVVEEVVLNDDVGVGNGGGCLA